MIEAETIQKMLEESHDQIVGDLKEKIVNRVSDIYGWEFDSLIKTTVKDFYKEHVAPEIAEHLMSEKGVIIEAVKSGAADIGAKLAEAMVKQATENMTGYSARKIFEDLLT